MTTTHDHGTAKARLRPLRTALMAVAALPFLVAPAGGAELNQAAPPPIIRDVDLNEVKVEDALHLLAELYDTSIATGKLPDEPVSVRLRAVGVDDAFAALAAAANLKVERRGSVILVSPIEPAPEEDLPAITRSVVLGPFSADLETALRWLNRTGVTVERLENGAAALIEGPEQDVERAKAALDDLRTQGVQASRANKIFRLGLADGEQTLAAVTALLDPDTEKATYDVVAHVLSLTGFPKTIAKVEQLLTQMQTPPPQYEIEVRVVEVSKNALARVGAKGGFRLDMRAGSFPTPFPMRDLSDGARFFPSPADLATLSDLADTVGGAATTAGAGGLADSGFVFGQVDGRGINMLIEYLEESGEAKIVATPKVTALDNRMAKVSIVTTLRIPTFTQNDAFATTTVSGIEEIDVGTTLEVRPRRTSQGHVLLKVTPEVSEVSGSVATAAQAGTLTQGLPIVSKRRAETEVILASGETLVIGGLIRETESEVDGSVPGLSSIPLLGELFKHKGKESGSSELLIFVTPHELPSASERRDNARVDDKWIPRSLATRLAAARASMRAGHAGTRLEGVRLLESLDAELMDHLLDVERDVVVLGGDEDIGVRRAAALFLLHRRPGTAMDNIRVFKDARQVAVTVLEARVAPHLRTALAELVAATPGGVEMIEERLRSVIPQANPRATGALLGALSAVAPENAARIASRLADDDRAAVASAALDALGGSGGDSWLELLARTANTGPTTELREYAAAALERATSRSILVADPAVSWAGDVAAVHVSGDRGSVFKIEEALELLSKKAPDFRHLLDAALAEIVAGAPTTRVDPETRTLWISDREGGPERLAHCLVRLAMPIYESRVRSFSPEGARSVARAVREEIQALERISGAASTEAEADATVAAVLRKQEAQ